MKRKLLFFALLAVFFAPFAFSFDWNLTQQSVKDEFDDEIGVEELYAYGDRSDKCIVFTIAEDESGYSFSDCVITFYGNGRKDNEDSKPCTIRIKDDAGRIVDIRSNCKILTEGLGWVCMVELDRSESKRAAAVFVLNKSPKLVINVQGMDSYNYGKIECDDFRSANCLKGRHNFVFGKCEHCGAEEDLLNLKMVKVESAYAYAAPNGASSFYIADTEVTQALYKSVTGENPSRFNGGDLRPVEQVSWYDAVEFCNRLSEMKGLEKCYSGSGEDIECDFTKNGYRLPTESEWKYAAKGGDKSKGFKYSGSNDIGEVAWYDGNSSGETHPVKRKKPNELGLYDMSGNVWEWCWDSYSTSSPDRINRGGGWDNGAVRCSVPNRDHWDPSKTFSYLGFRLARSDRD